MSDIARYMYYTVALCLAVALGGEYVNSCTGYFRHCRDSVQLITWPTSAVASCDADQAMATVVGPGEAGLGANYLIVCQCVSHIPGSPL